MDTISRSSDRKSSPLKDTKKRDLQARWGVSVGSMWQPHVQCGKASRSAYKGNLARPYIARKHELHPLGSIEEDEQTSDVGDQNQKAAEEGEFGSFSDEH